MREWVRMPIASETYPDQVRMYSLMCFVCTTTETHVRHDDKGHNPQDYIPPDSLNPDLRRDGLQRAYAHRNGGEVVEKD